MADNRNSHNPSDKRRPADTLRLIEDGAASGPWNMAADESLLASAAETGIATLRFYRWDQPTLSLGYFQRQAERGGHQASRHCPLVRRHSGGGAIVHDRELTYALCWPVAGRANEVAARLYTTIHQALVGALDTFGMPGELHAGLRNSAADEPFLCFQRRAAGDVCLTQHKIMGSAQRRRRGAILQHGSLLLGRSPAAPQLLGITDLDSGNSLTDDLFSCHGKFVTEWKQRIEEGLAVRLERSGLTADELARTRELIAHKFSADAWNGRR